MELPLLPVILFLVLNGETLGHPQVLNVIPTGGLGQTVYSTVPVTGQQLLTTQASVQPSVVQLLRQPGFTQFLGQPAYSQVYGQPGLTQVYGGGLNQIVGGHPALSQVQVVGGGVGLNGAGVPLVSTVPGLNGLPYGSTIGLPGTTATNLNGLPVVLSGASGVHYLNNGLQTVTALPTEQIAQQPIVTANPVVVRQIPEVEETASVVQLDPMDAALLDLENKGEIHMEKYAWGRSNLADKEKANLDTDNTGRERKADLPVYLSPVPTRGVLTTPAVSSNRYVPSPSRVRNPFLGEGGKRKKHFEHYEYFRNLDLGLQQVYVPMTVFPVNPSSPSASPPTA